MIALPQSAMLLPHSEVLSRITATDPSAALDPNHLTVSLEDPTGIERVPVPQVLEDLENRVVGLLADRIPRGENPRILLFAPGLSRTDPLYALRFLSKLAMATGRTGELTAYDVRGDIVGPLQQYYGSLPWNGHTVRLALGREGNIERLRGAAAHFILAIHSSLGPDFLFPAFAGNLIRGGIALTQSTVLPELSDSLGYDIFMTYIKDMYGDSLDLLHPPLREHIFHSFFADRSNDVHMMAMEKL